VKSEAQDLAKLLRTSIGEPTLVPAAGGTKTPVKKPASIGSPAPSASTKAPSKSNDPFEGFK
jgi:hypothetical protein